MFDPNSFSQASFSTLAWKFIGAIVATVSPLITFFRRRRR